MILTNPEENTGTGNSFDLKSRTAIAVILAFFVLLYSVTRPDIDGDTPVYAGDILKYWSTGVAPPTFWDFGHLLWRPLGYLLWKFAQPLMHLIYGDSPLIEVTAILFAVSFLSALVLTLVSFFISRRLGASNIVSALISVGILLCNAVINYVHSGCSYIAGMTLEFVGFWLILQCVQEPGHRQLRAAAGGMCFALAFGFWFPFSLGVPMALLVPLLAKPGSYARTELKRGDRLQILAGAVIAIAAAGTLLFVLGAVLDGVSSLAEFKVWVLRSGHNIHMDRRYIRFPTGVSRSFLYLGDEAVAIKRFVFKDPYAPVRLLDVLNVALWKVALVFVTFGVLFWSLGKKKHVGVVLAISLTGIVLNLGFALFVFDTGQPERYLPMYVALVVALCEVLRQKAERVTRWTLGIFLLSLALVNLKTYGWDLRNSANAAAGRVSLMHQHTQNGGVTLVLSFKDPISSYFQRSPFDSGNRLGALPLHHVTEVEFGDPAPWQTQTSCRILKSWSAAGEILMSKRLVASRPDPEWGWVEHDSPNLSWSSLSSFFKQIGTDENLGGRDGFLRVAKTPANLGLFQRTCGAVTAHS